MIFKKITKSRTPFYACLFKFITDFCITYTHDSSNQLHDAALLTRGYTQHAFRPYNRF